MRTSRQAAVTILGLLAALLAAGTAGADPVEPAGPPTWLPRYDLDMHLDVAGHTVKVHQTVTWINRHPQPTNQLVFNAHSHYKIPDGDVALLAKTLELLRQAPSEGIDFDGPALQVEKVVLSTPGAACANMEFCYQDDNPTALVVTLPHPVGQGEAVTVALDFTLRLPQKQGRWGQWEGVTFLATWLPVLAYYDDKEGWQPTPFVPWHQPFFNEAGLYTARVTLPCDQKIACSGSVTAVKDLGDGRKQVDIAAPGFRDFAFLCSARYQEFVGEAVSAPGCPPVRVKVVAFPEHEFYARSMVRALCEAVPVYSRWFGPYPYPEFTLAESFFAWNGNECGGLVMIDARTFAMPHMAEQYVEYLVSHEFCHQWWYNLIGTNGYCETWMDEALAVYFSHRLIDCKHGKNNGLMRFPAGLEWLPNIQRDNYRYYSLYGVLGRGDNGPILRKMPDFDHLVNLLSMCYDKGSKVVGLIEERLGEAAFLDFIHIIYRKYQYRILRVADFQRELEAYTGRSWEEFFAFWLHGPGVTDWCVEKVRLEPRCEGIRKLCGLGPCCGEKGPYKVTVLLHQKAECCEETTLGFCFDGGEGFQLRLPIQPQAGIVELDDPPAKIEPLPANRVRVEVTLPRKPTQIAVDPDQVLVDRNPTNNYWKPRIRWRLTPVYSLVEETDFTCDYDKWNVIAGPWVFGTAYSDPWFTRSTMAGARVGLYRTQEFSGGAYVGYRTDFNDIVAGVDGLWDHWPWPHTQVGFAAERRLGATMNEQQGASRGVVFGRYVFTYGSSLYLPPMKYVEAFASFTDNFLPWARNNMPGCDRFDHAATGGLHYHIDYLTPYWDAEAGYKLDVTYASGVALVGTRESFNRVDGQVSAVKSLPDWLGPLSQTRLAARLYGAAGLPDKGQYFSLGGETLFRGFDLAERQGSVVWVGSLEWRVPLVRGLTWDCCDHTLGLRNVYAAAFYDVGDIYCRGHSMGPVAHAVGGGIRLDTAWFSFIERTILRFDIAKAVNASTPVQFWFGVMHPF
jgi:hypothetical protein